MKLLFMVTNRPKAFFSSFSITTILVIIIISGIQALHAKTLDSLALTKIGEKLVHIELEQGEGVKDDNCLRDENGNFLSCFSAESSVDWISDFNADGNPDAVFMFMDEGLGGGGNAFGFEYRLVLLDDKQNILNQYSIFGGGKFSFAHLSTDSVSKNRIYATYEENPMSRDFGQEDKPLKQTSLVFVYEDGRIVEEHYRNCPLAAMKKQVFRKDKGLTIKDTHEMDDQFNDSYTERVTMADSTEIMAILSGCEDLELYFSRTIPYNKNLKNNKSAVKLELLNNLAYLRDNTLFKTIINNTYSKLNLLENELIKPDIYGSFVIHLQLTDRWQAHLFVSGNEEQGSFITIRFEKLKNAKAMDFWESMESRNRLIRQK